LLGSIGSFLKPVVSVVKTAGQALLGGVSSSLFSSAQSALGGGGKTLGDAIPTTAGAMGGGLLQTKIGAPATGYHLPTTIGSNLPVKANPTPGGLMQRIGSGLGQLASGAIAGSGMGGVTRMKRGKLTGNAIPAGYVERMSPSGVIYLAKQKRRRGITARDLSAYRRVDRLVHRIARSHSSRRK